MKKTFLFLIATLFPIMCTSGDNQQKLKSYTYYELRAPVKINLDKSMLLDSMFQIKGELQKQTPIEIKAKTDSAAWVEAYKTLLSSQFKVITSQKQSEKKYSSIMPLKFKLLTSDSIDITNINFPNKSQISVELFLKHIEALRELGESTITQ